MDQRKLNYFYPRCKKVRNCIFFLSVIIIIALTSGIVKPIYADSNFYLSTKPGCQMHQVDYCNLQLWKDTINTTSNPSDWFPGRSNQTGTQSRRIIPWIGTGGASAFALFLDIYEAFNIDSTVLNDNGYDSLFVDTAYRYEYLSWMPGFFITYFKNPPFEEDEKLIEFRPRILYNLADYSRLITDYHNFTSIVNNDPTMQSLNFSLPEFNGDDFLMYLILNELVIASPINGYLNELTNSLGCKNAVVQGNSLILNRTGITDYQIKVTFNTQGLIGIFTVTSANRTLIFMISSWYPADDVIYIFWGIMIGLVALLGIAFWRWRKRAKFFKEN